MLIPPEGLMLSHLAEVSIELVFCVFVILRPAFEPCAAAFAHRRKDEPLIKG